MARGAKEQNLNAGKRIAQALVPEHEQPHKVPANWVWARLGFLIQISKERSEDFSGEEQKYVGLEHIQKDAGLCGYGSSLEIKSLKNVFRSGEILYGRLRPYLNKHDVASFDGVCSTEILVFAATTLIADSRYVNYFLDTDWFIEYAVSSSKGINLPRVSESVVLESVCPLPPLAEQQRIVERIESLFAKLDQAKELAQHALDSFETRRASVLHKAFTGQLTAKWREEHDVGMESWEEKQLREVCSIITDGTHQTPTYADEGYIFLSSKNVTSGMIDWENIKYIPNELHEQLHARLAPQRDDVLLAKNGTTGVAAIVDKDRVFDIYVSLALLRPDQNVINPRYLLQSINSPMTKEKFNGELTGIGLQNLHLRDIRSTEILVPSLQEQQEIVRILDSLFRKEQQAKDLCSALGKIDLMKKAILARAFRGQLGTNEPSEESSIEPLKACLLDD